MGKQRSVKHRNEHPRQSDWLNTVEHDFNSDRHDYTLIYERWYNRQYVKDHPRRPDKVAFQINPKWRRCYE